MFVKLRQNIVTEISNQRRNNQNPPNMLYLVPQRRMCKFFKHFLNSPKQNFHVNGLSVRSFHHDVLAGLVLGGGPINQFVGFGLGKIWPIAHFLGPISYRGLAIGFVYAHFVHEPSSVQFYDIGFAVRLNARKLDQIGIEPKGVGCGTLKDVYYLSTCSIW